MRATNSSLKGTLTFQRFQIPYRVFGEGEDIVCLNGAQQSMAMWASFLQRFSRNYRITLFDFPHQGKARIEQGPVSVSLDEQVDILHAVIKGLGVRFATICSASWGGVVALLFALRFPEYTKRLILASIGMRPNERMKDIILSGISMDINDRRKMADSLISSFGESLPEFTKKQIVAQFQGMPEERVRAFSEHGLSVIFNGSLDKVVPLSQIRKNTIVLYGEKDRIIDFKDVEAMEKVMPNCKVRVIPGVGHFLHLESEKIFDVYEDIMLSDASSRPVSSFITEERSKGYG